MDTQALAVLVNAVSAGSLSGASRRLGLTPVVASRRLAALERDLGVRLLQRTTRSLSLTVEGEALLPYAREILEREAAATAALKPAQSEASGLLRMTAPSSLCREVIAPLLPALLAAHPKLRVELHLTERMVDLVAEGIDLAVRIAGLRDAELVARRIGTARRVIVASPSYLARKGRPETRADLADHDCLHLIGAQQWLFDTPSGVDRVRVSGPLTCDAIDGLHAASREGLGITMLSSWSAAEDLASGRLIAVPLDAKPHAPPISAVYSNARMATPRVRVLLSALTTALNEGEGI